jgi:hypothetical protein
MLAGGAAELPHPRDGMRARRAGTPPRRTGAAESSRVESRRGPGAVGHGGIVPYGARSPVPSPGEEHAQIQQFMNPVV